jgi:indole-3-glycerol phosphate synthase
VSASRLDEIVAATRLRNARRAGLPLPQRPPALGAPWPGRLRDALRRQGPEAPLRFLCEVKRASPSRGVLRSGLQAASLARQYASAGADAVSVLTEPDFFLGAPEDLTDARLACGLPCLQKDFVLEPRQVDEAAGLGADGVLLIAAILDDPALVTLLAHARASGLDALVEVHDEGELARAAAAGADLIGVNHRDLATFDVDLTVSARLAPLTPRGAVVVAESGISAPEDLQRLSRLGLDAVLIGEHLVCAERPGDALATLRAAAERAVAPASRHDG